MSEIVSLDYVNPNHEVYRNKTSCVILKDCIIDLREFGKHAEYEQNYNVKVYSNGRRVRKYINRNPLNNAVWYSESIPTMQVDFSFAPLNIPIDREIDEMFLCYDYLEWQYSHFLTDVYPKMWYYPEMRKTRPNLKFGQIRPIVNLGFNLNDKTLQTKMNTVSDFAHDITDFYLTHKGFMSELCPLEAGKVYHINTMIVPIPFTSQDSTPWPQVQYDMYDLLLKESLRLVPKTYPERVFISRRDTQKNGWFNLRHCMNEDKISTALKEIGFETIELMPLNIFEKIKVFHDATTVVQAVGSNCFNCIFSKPETNLVTLVHPFYVGWCPMLQNLAEHQKCNFVPVTDGIELLGLGDYPEKYKRQPDQPWTFTKIKELVDSLRGTTVETQLSQADVPISPEQSKKKLSISFNARYQIAEAPLEDIGQYLLNNRKIEEFSPDSWLFTSAGDKNSPLTLLDFGCGLGRNTFGAALYSPLWKVTGYDCAPMLRRTPEYAARKRYPHPPNLMFGSEWEHMREEKFDVIMAVLVFQHIDESDLILYLEDFSRMTNRILVNGRRFNDDAKKNTWEIMHRCGLRPIEEFQDRFSIDGPPDEHTFCVFEFER